jgi:hypothetical protein
LSNLVNLNLMSLQCYRVSNLLIWTCVSSYVEFCLFQKLQVAFFVFLAWFMHCQQGGEVRAWIGLLQAFRRFPSVFELFFSSDSFLGGINLTGEGHRSDRCSSQVLGDLVHWSDRWGWPVWPVRAELLQLLCFMKWFTCIRPGGVALVQGELACVQGELFVVSSFGLLNCALCLSMFCLGCVESLPLPKRSETCLLQVIFLPDGEIWTAHGGVNPCGLVVPRGDWDLRTRWLC